MSDAPKRYRTKHDRYEAKLAQIDAELPPVDIGQFENVERSSSHMIPSDRVLAVAQRITQGATLRDACTLAGVSLRVIHKWARALREYEAGEVDHIDPYILACAVTIERARSITRLRWQMLAEGGGTGSATALWMLERRGGREYRAPAQRHEVKRESTEVVVNTSLEQTIEATAQQLGIDPDKLKEQGDYWARAITASQRGSALPSPPSNEDD